MPSDDTPKRKKPSSNSELSNSAKILGAAGGRVGGRKRAEALTAEERSKIAKMGGQAAAAKRKVVKAKLKKRKGDSKK